MHDHVVHAVFLGAVGVALLGGAVALSPARTSDQVAQTIYTDTSTTPTTYTQPTTYTAPTTYTTPTTDTTNTSTVYVGPTTTEQLAPTVSTTIVEPTPIVPPTTIQPVTEPVLTTAMTTPTCPLRPEPNRTIVDFTRGGTVGYPNLVLVANGTKDQAYRSIVAKLVPGVYDVRLAGFDAHVATTKTEYREIWRLELIDVAGAVLRSTASRDIRDTESLVVETVDRGMLVKQGIVRVITHHAAYPDEVSQSVAPLCAAFDRIGDLPVVTSTYTITPTTTPTTTVSTTALNSLPAVYPRCPFPTHLGRTIVDFTKQGTMSLADLVVQSDGTKTSATKAPVPIVLPRGTYTVRLASYGGTIDGVTYPGQTWRAVLYGTDGAVVTTTPPSRDVPDWNTDFASLVAESFTVPAQSVRIGALHGEYPSTTAGPVAVLCAAFDALEVHSTATAPAPVPAVVVQDTPALAPVPVVPTDQGEVKRPAEDTMQVVKVVSPTAVPVSIGIESALRVVPVPEESFIKAREDFVARTNAPLFPMLARAQTGEREAIVTQLLAREESASTSASTTPTQTRVSLARVSDESEMPTTEVDDSEQRATPLLKRAGLISLRDTDGDGITDYDEEHIYATDPEDPFTGKSVFTDGERVLLGLDPLASSTEVVLTESPRQSGHTTDLLSVASVGVVASSSLDGTATTGGLYVTGQAPPLSFVTLYLYSTPVMVTVRADSAGRYEYTFDHTLDDGSHELYVASVNNAGKILAKSEPLPFVKTAEAISFTPPSVGADPVMQGTHTSITFTLLLLLLAAIGSIIAIGVWKTHQVGSSPEGAPHDEHHA